MADKPTDNEREQARLREQTPQESSATSKADRQVVSPEDDKGVPAPEYIRASAPENALVGDEAVYGLDSPTEAEVVTDAVPAQVMSDEVVVVDEIPVHETYVQMDRVVLDPSAPEAVQIPDAGRGFLELPIHQLANGTAEEAIGRGDNEVTPPDES